MDALFIHPKLNLYREVGTIEFNGAQSAKGAHINSNLHIVAENKSGAYGVIDDDSSHANADVASAGQSDYKHRDNHNVNSNDNRYFIIKIPSGFVKPFTIFAMVLIILTVIAAMMFCVTYRNISSKRIKYNHIASEDTEII